jgi:hypothetical protein
MKLYVGVTDNDWYRFLSRLPDVDEINFKKRDGVRLLQVDYHVLALIRTDIMARRPRLFVPGAAGEWGQTFIC